MIDLPLLQSLLSNQAIEAARDAMDLSSVSGFSFDRRGRLEGGIKPAPPCTETPSYARITKRGKHFLPDCRSHGRGNWCIHTIILALHHIGVKPSYTVRHAEQPQKNEPELGFRLLLELDPEVLRIKIKSLSTAKVLSEPLKFFRRDSQLFKLSSRALELMEDLHQGDRLSVTVARVDAAPLLSELKSCALFNNAAEPYHWVRIGRKPPVASIRIDGNLLKWDFDTDIHSEAILLPGWSGYLIEGTRISRVDGFLPDFQKLVGTRSSELSLTPENLELILRERHGVSWKSEKPGWVSRLDHPSLRLQRRNQDLHGELGIVFEDRFFPIHNLEQSPQILCSQGRLCLFSPNLTSLSKLMVQSRAMKAPWDKNRPVFSLRQQQAPEFLQKMEVPEQWHVERRDVDRWFGVERLPVTSHWHEEGLRYEIGDEIFSHETLLGGLLEGHRGARLPDGRLLSFDSSLVQKNETIYSGVRQLHNDPVRQQNLIRRIASEPVDEKPDFDQIPVLTKYWQGKLRSYQREGVQWLLGRYSQEEPALLADDMGLGKTIQTLAYLDVIKEDKPQLIVVPTSLLWNWREECQKFCPKRKLLVHHGPKRARDPEALQKEKLIITSFGTLRRDIDWLYDVAFQVVVVDEAQAIKNHASQISRAACELWSDHRLALTGTPIENRVSELWSIFQFLAPGYLGDESEVKTISNPGSAQYRAVREMVGPFLKRRLKKQVEKDLPEKQEITVMLPLLDEQKSLYEAVLRESRKTLAQPGQKTMSILTKLLRLRQICCHPGLVDDVNIGVGSNKFNFLVQSLEDVMVAGHGALVFSQFTQLLQLLKFQLEEKAIPFLYLDGRSRDRQSLVKRFQEGEAPVFLISLKAGGTGLNLTRASYVYHLDPWWNPMVEAQATDRSHRIGQTRRVISYKLISEATVEEKILKMQSGKKLLAEGLWEDGEALKSKLDRDTLMGLLD